MNKGKGKINAMYSFLFLKPASKEIMDVPDRGRGWTHSFSAKYFCFFPPAHGQILSNTKINIKEKLQQTHRKETLD